MNMKMIVKTGLWSADQLDDRHGEDHQRHGEPYGLVRGAPRRRRHEREPHEHRQHREQHGARSPPARPSRRSGRRAARSAAPSGAVGAGRGRTRRCGAASCFCWWTPLHGGASTSRLGPPTGVPASWARAGHHPIPRPRARRPTLSCPPTEEILRLLAGSPGHRFGRLGRAADDPSLWAMVSEWEGAGYYRRALGAYEIRLALIPLSTLAIDEAGRVRDRRGRRSVKRRGVRRMRP